MQNYKPEDKISKFFTYKEFLWLPQWNRMGDASDGLTDEVLDRLKAMAQKMDLVREFLGAPIRVHVAWRPTEYNKLVKGAKASTHLAASGIDAAVDFSVKGMTCDEVKKKILDANKLEEWDLRMEDNGAGANWVHLDTRKPAEGRPRFFKP